MMSYFTYLLESEIFENIIQFLQKNVLMMIVGSSSLLNYAIYIPDLMTCAARYCLSHEILLELSSYERGGRKQGQSCHFTG
jgi:hypothetical protein